MSWTDYTANLEGSGFSGACIIDVSTTAVLASTGDMIPRGYQVDGVDVNENTYLSADWSSLEFTSIRFNRVKYMVLRKDPVSILGKKGNLSIMGFKLNTIFLIGVADADKLNPENANNIIGKMYDALRTAGV